MVHELGGAPDQQKSQGSCADTNPIDLLLAICIVSRVVLAKSEHLNSSDSGLMQVNGECLTGIFQRIPQVPSAETHIKSALRKAHRLQGNKNLKGKVQHARNLSARKLDALTKEISVPLGVIVKGFPPCARMHPFEQALLDLTIGSGIYEKRLQQLDNLRKSCLQVILQDIQFVSQASNDDGEAPSLQCGPERCAGSSEWQWRMSNPSTHFPSNQV